MTRFLADYSTLLKLKAPTWTRQDLQEAIEAVVTQKMRFTQASTRYGIPKGTLYDNILGKSKRMMVLEEAGLNTNEETAVLEFCCDTTVSPYNRRTKKSLNTVLNFVERLRRRRDPGFVFTGLSGFRWWWAFCKKHSIVSLYFYDDNENEWPWRGDRDCGYFQKNIFFIQYDFHNSELYLIEFEIVRFLCAESPFPPSNIQIAIHN